MPHEPTSTEVAATPKEHEEAALTRRDAIGALGLAGAAVVAGGYMGLHAAPEKPVHPGPATSRALDKPYVKGSEHFGTREERWVATSCGQCPAGCGVRVRVVEGRAVRIDGNAANPLNRGGIGPRGLSALQALYDADRIEGPLVREGNKLVSIAWSDAMTLLVQKLSAARARGGEKLVVMTGRERGFVHDLLARFARSFGTPHFIDGRPSRSQVFAQAMLASLGSFEVPVFDWARAEYVVSLGAGVLEDSCQLVYLARSSADVHRSRPGKRTSIVHLAPSFDLSANGADEWIPIQPGSSAAIALSMSRVLVRDGLYDKRFATEAARDFGAFAAWLEAFEPKEVAEKSGVPARTIERLAANLASRRPSFVYADERTFSFSNGWEAALAVLSLNALLGAIGTLVRIEPKAPLAAWPAEDLDAAARAGVAKPRIDRAGSAEFPLAHSVHETLPEAFSADPPDVLLIDQANPAYARKQPARWREALAKVPFVVTTSPFLDETTQQVASLVLPDHTFLERWDDAAQAPGAGIPVVGVRKPVVEPYLDTRHTGDVLLDLAHALGGSVARSFPWKTAREALEARLVGLFEAKRGSIIDAKPAAFFDRLFEQGFWCDADAVDAPLQPFPFQRVYADAEWMGDAAQYPLKLIVYRPLGYAEGSGANLPWLRQLRSRPGSPRTSGTLATIHPDAVPGTATGDVLEVTSPFGTINVVARLDPRIDEGSIAIPMGGGHEAFGRWAEDRGANVMRLLDPKPARQTGANVLSGTRVRVAKRRGGRA